MSAVETRVVLNPLKVLESTIENFQIIGSADNAAFKARFLGRLGKNEAFDLPFCVTTTCFLLLISTIFLVHSYLCVYIHVNLGCKDTKTF